MQRPLPLSTHVLRILGEFSAQSDRAGKDVHALLLVRAIASEFMEIVFNNKTLVQQMIDDLPENEETLADYDDGFWAPGIFIDKFWRRSVLADVLTRLEDPANRVSVAWDVDMSKAFTFEIETTQM